MRYYFISLIAVLVLVLPWFVFNFPNETNTFFTAVEDVGSQLAAVVINHNPKTVDQIQTRYRNSAQNTQPKQKVKVLIVPGHEPSYGGAEYGSLKERQMTVELADDLKQFMQGNDRFDIAVTRDHDSWTPTFADYFKNYWNDIVEWQKAHKNEQIKMTQLGTFKPVPPSVFHNKAPENVAYRLYGIDKWSNDNDVDIVIHIHFNDYPGHGRNTPGDYSGFTIYVPDKQYYNSTTTRVLAENVFKRLEKYNAVSDLPGEKSGIVEDQDLIAVGSYNSVNAASMLIEYGYIYEKQFTDPALRSLAIKDLAFQTYLGLQDFLDPNSAVSFAGSFDTLLMPYKWGSDAVGSRNKPTDIFALQTALILDGDYPPDPMSMNDCPRTGAIGPCTKSAIKQFQKKYGLESEGGELGQKTIEQLNRLYSLSII